MLIGNKQKLGTLAGRLLSSQLRINVVSGMTTAIVCTVVLAVAYPVYLDLLGYEKYGVWLILTTVLAFAQLGGLGIGSAVTKLVAEEHGRGDILGVHRYIAAAFVLVCVSGAAVLAIVLALRRQIVELFALTGENAQTALCLLPYMGLLSLCMLAGGVFEAALSGLGRMDLTSYRGLSARVMNLCISIGLLHLGGGIESLLIGRTIAELVTHLAVFLCVRRMTHFRILRMAGLDLSRCKRLLSFGGTILGNSLLSMLVSPVNKLVLSRHLGTASLPVYEMAFTGSMQVKGLVIAGHVAMIPEISRLSTELTSQVRIRIRKLCLRSLQLILLLATPAYGVLLIFTPALLKLWLGDGFTEAQPQTFRIMLMGTFISVLGNPAYHMFIGMGYVRCALMAHIIEAVTNLIIVLFVCTAFQITVTAVAWSSSIGMAAATVHLVLQKRHTLRDTVTP